MKAPRPFFVNFPADEPRRSTVPLESPVPFASNLLPLDWLLDPLKDRSLPNRVLARLIQSEAHEPDVWLRDDYRQTWIALYLATQGVPDSLTVASYRMYGLHPDKVWPAILRNREAMLRNTYPTQQSRLAPGTGRLVDEAPFADGTSSLPAYESPKKPCASERRRTLRKKAA